MTESKGSYAGTPVEDMAKEELIEALIHMAELYQEALKPEPSWKTY